MDLRIATALLAGADRALDYVDLAADRDLLNMKQSTYLGEFLCQIGISPWF